MKNLIVIGIVFVIATIIVLAVKAAIFKKDVKDELGVYPNEFKSQIYSPMEVQEVKNLVDRMGGKFNEVTKSQEPDIKPNDKARTTLGSGITAWAVGIAEQENLELDKDYGVLESSGRFWVSIPKYAQYIAAATNNAKYTLETNGIELSNPITRKVVKTQLMDKHGINIDNKYFVKLFKKHNKR